MFIDEIIVYGSFIFFGIYFLICLFFFIKFIFFTTVVETKDAHIKYRNHYLES